jgi:hypothetical protein
LKLQAAQKLEDVSQLLGFTPSGLAYLLYKLPNDQKYTTFEIPKRSGGKRQIKAPVPSLALLQRRLGGLLYECFDEIIAVNPKRKSLAHGFVRSHSIISNASLHKRRRYVLNLDLQDFFPSLNFGRVRGYFIKDHNFKLNESVATIIAQIACHDNELPQGSPCSPVISNFIGHILDGRLVHLAKTNRCTYSRYVDDITFSTNQKVFPSSVAELVPNTKSTWQLNAQLIAKIEHSGFTVNAKKTRMQYRGSRQVVTGLMVNEKVNVRPEYARNARAMCAELFKSGTYYKMVPAALVGGEVGDAPMKQPFSNLNALQEILSHVDYIKNLSDKRAPSDKCIKPTSTRKLYAQFLFYKHFVAPECPLILPEGKTDAIYLRAAIKKLTAYHPELGKVENGKFISSIRIMNYSRVVHEVMQLGGGSGDLKNFLGRYRVAIDRFSFRPFLHPVIIVIDNDEGAKDIFSVAKSYGLSNLTLASQEPFYHLRHNVYLVKTPELGENSMSCIEDLFPESLLKTTVDGKTFDPNKKHKAAGKYGKAVFAEKVVEPNIATIDFVKFGSLLERVVAVLLDYKTKLPLSAAA